MPKQIADFITDFNKSISDILTLYLNINNKLHTVNNNLELTQKQSYVNYLQLINVSMDDLIINMQTLQYLFEGEPDLSDTLQPTQTPLTQHNTTQHNTTQHNTTQQSNINYNRLVNKTINELLPLFMVHMMSNDNKSILNSETFNNIKNHIQYEQSNNIIDNKDNNKYDNKELFKYSNICNSNPDDVD